LPSDHPLEGCDLGLVFLDQVRRLRVLVERASLELSNSDPDQLPRHVVPLGQRVRGVTRDELSCYLPLERDAV
jgi:nitrogen-specific signal transduction histidine kinase